MRRMWQRGQQRGDLLPLTGADESCLSAGEGGLLEWHRGRLNGTDRERLGC